MRTRTFVTLIVLWPVPALAMNWEGHDDWMLGFAPAYTLEAFAPDAKPLPSRNCPVSLEASTKNRYEQIPLPRHKCAGSHEKDAPQR